MNGVLRLLYLVNFFLELVEKVLEMVKFFLQFVLQLCLISFQCSQFLVRCFNLRPGFFGLMSFRVVFQRFNRFNLAAHLLFVGLVSHFGEHIVFFVNAPEVFL